MLHSRAFSGDPIAYTEFSSSKSGFQSHPASEYTIGPIIHRSHPDMKLLVPCAFFLSSPFTSSGFVSVFGS